MPVMRPEGYAELRVLSIIKEKASQMENLIQLIDHFEHDGLNGTHLCLVLELMWMNVRSFIGARDQPKDRIIYIDHRNKS